MSLPNCSCRLLSRGRNIMECSWTLRRYSRCFTDYHKQATDITSQTSLFPYFANSKNSSSVIKSQLINTGVWSTIMHNDKISLQLKLKLGSEASCSLQVHLLPRFDDWELRAAEHLKQERTSTAEGPIVLV